MDTDINFVNYLFSVCFKVFDIDSDGILNMDEITEMINILLFVSKESSSNTNSKSYTYDEVLADLQNRLGKTSTEEVSLYNFVCYVHEQFCKHLNRFCRKPPQSTKVQNHLHLLKKIL